MEYVHQNHTLVPQDTFPAPQMSPKATSTAFETPG